MLKDGGQDDTNAAAVSSVMEISEQGDCDKALESKSLSLQEKCQCCCKEHCKMSFHNYYKTKTYFQPTPTVEEQMLEVFNIEGIPDEEMEEDGEVIDDDNFTTYIMGIRLNLA